MRGRKCNPPSLQEQQFQEAFKRWEESDYTDLEAWHIMFHRVYECCFAIAQKMCMGVYNPKLLDRTMDAAIYYMNRIKNEHIHPRKLSSWCYLGTKGNIWGVKQQREDKEASYDEFVENGYTGSTDILGYVTDDFRLRLPETVRGICRSELMNTID